LLPGWLLLREDVEEDHRQQPPPEGHHEDAPGGQQQLLRIECHLEAGEQLHPRGRLTRIFLPHPDLLLDHAKLLRCYAFPAACLPPRLRERARNPSGRMWLISKWALYAGMREGRGARAWTSATERHGRWTPLSR